MVEAWTEVNDHRYGKEDEHAWYTCLHHATNLALESGPLNGLTEFNELWLGYA